MLALKFCLATTGLIFPGYLLARLLRIGPSWAVAFPFSVLLLVETVQLFALTGVAIRFETMLMALGGYVLCSLAWLRARSPAGSPEEGPKLSSTALRGPLPVAALCFSLTMLCVVVVRTALYPLNGPDTAFRWEGLAVAMLQHQSLDFYPPVTAADYTVYLYADGIPPLVASVYWWLYAAIGQPLPQTTALSVGLQLGAIMTLTFYAARQAFGERAAWFALLALGVSPLLLYGVAIGQETGFTALAVAGQLRFCWTVVRQPRRSTVIAAALFAALGALSRDYGPALALAGVAVLLWHRETRRFLPLFLATVLVLAAPWYLRSWVLTGNPFYSHRLPGGFDVNPVHAAIFDYYREGYAFATITAAGWLKLFGHLLAGVGIVLGSGLFAARWLCWRKTGALWVTVLVVALLWVVSVGQTAGGVLYSTRVLTPAVVALAIMAGAILADFSEGSASRSRQRMIGLLLLLAGGYALMSMANYPQRSRFLFAALTGTYVGSLQERVLERLEATTLPATGVLTEMTFLAESMKRASRFRPIMHWNPEVAFLFDSSLTADECRRRLWENNIKLILVDYKSPNNKFLSGYEFFRDSAGWKLVFKFPGEFALYYIK